MMPKWHIFTSAILSLVMFRISGSFHASLACFIAGTIIDIDHVLDYYLYSGRLTFNVSKISGFYSRYGKVIILLHSYELLLIGAVFAYFLQAHVLFIGAAIGFVGHLLMDTAGYGMKAQSYFLSYRVYCGFGLERLCE